MNISETTFTPQQVCRMLQLDISPRTLIRDEDGGKIPPASRTDSGYRYWALKDFPKIANYYRPVKHRSQAIVEASYMSKGGTGKTTFILNKARYLAITGHRVLLIGCDFQCNMSKYFGITAKDNQPSLYEMITSEKSVHDVILHTDLETLDIIPENGSLNELELEMLGMPRREYVLEDHLEVVKDEYDYILIDCPPNMGSLVINALMVADIVTGLVTADDDCYTAFVSFVRSLAKFKKRMKKNWMGMKFVVNKFDSRQSIDQDYWASYKENFPKYFTSEKIRSAAAIKKASAARMSIFEYSAKEGVVADYQKVLNELSVFTEKSFDEYQKAKNEHEKRSKERKKKKSDQQESI